MAIRTWAPRGQTPVVRVPLTRDHLIADQRHHARWASVPARTPSLLHGLRGGRRDSRVLMRTIAGPILLIWDGTVRRFVADKAERAERPRTSETTAMRSRTAMALTHPSQVKAVLDASMPPLLLKSCGTELCSPSPQVSMAARITPMEMVAGMESSKAKRKSS